MYVFLGTRTVASTRVDDDERGRVDRELDAGDGIAIVDGRGRIRDKRENRFLFGACMVAGYWIMAQGALVNISPAAAHHVKV